MVKKKRDSKKKAGSEKAGKPVIFKEVTKIFVGITILVSLCLIIAMGADIFFQPEKVEKKKQLIPKPLDQSKEMSNQKNSRQMETKKAVKGLIEKSIKDIQFEIFDDIDQKKVEKPAPIEKDQMPKIAIIIDDIGYDIQTALALSKLNSNITFSILPFSPYGKHISEKLHAMGSQVMLHLPMEPVEYPNADPGTGAILSHMAPDVLLDQLKKNIKRVPYIKGVNNHMGSKLTTHANQMNQIFTILKKKNLFFIDSITAVESKCKSSAKLLKVKFAQRDIFLDNFQDTAYIKGQFQKIIDIAEKHGAAIGIGHPYEATLQTLSKELPKLQNKIKIVPANVLTSVPG